MEADSLRELWLQGEEDEMEVDLVALKTQSQALELSVRRRAVLESFAGGVVATVFAGWALYASSWLGTVGALLVVVGTLFVVVTLHRRGHGPSVNVAGSTADFLSSQRAQLVHQAELLEGVPLWYVGPLLPGLLTLMVSRVPGVETGSAGWVPWTLSTSVQLGLLTWVLWMNRRAAAELRREIDALPSPVGDSLASD